MKFYCRDLYVVSNFHQQRINQIKANRRELSDRPGYGDPMFLEIIDSIVAYAVELKKDNNVGAGNDGDNPAVGGSGIKVDVHGSTPKNAKDSGQVPSTSDKGVRHQFESMILCSSIPFGSADEEVCFVSGFMLRYQKTLAGQMRVEKEVQDFCFLDDEIVDQK